MGTARISNSPGTKEHFVQYFNKVVDPETKQSEYVFDWGTLKVVPGLAHR